MARITHLISERSLHSYHGCARRIGHRKTPPYLQPAPNVMWKHRADVSSHHNALSALVCLTRFVLVFVQHGVSTNFTRASPAELNYFKAGPVHGIFAILVGNLTMVWERPTALLLATLSWFIRTTILKHTFPKIKTLHRYFIYPNLENKNVAYVKTLKSIHYFCKHTHDHYTKNTIQYVP